MRLLRADAGGAMRNWASWPAIALAGTATFVLADRRVFAQGWQADLRVTAVQALVGGDNRFQCTIDVTSDNDDDARETRAVVVLPVSVTNVLSFQGTPQLPRSETCTTSSPSPPNSGAGDVRGFVACDLGQLAVGARRRIEVSSTVPPAAIRKTCGVFVWSKTPDPQPRNNYAEATAP